MNFARDVVDAAPRTARALVELQSRRPAPRVDVRRGVGRARRRLAGTLSGHGVQRGDVVLTLIGNRPEWVLTMLACFRLGAVALACNEQLRPKDLAVRLDAAKPAVIVADERNGDLAARTPPAVRC